MTFRQRLAIAFSIMLIVPAVLFTVAFWAIGTFVSRTDDSRKIQEYTMLSGSERNSEALDGITAQIIAELPEGKLEDPEYLEALSGRIDKLDSGIVVRRGNELYYSGGDPAAGDTLALLPAWTGEDEIAPPYYSNVLEKMVRQVDFTFSDGAQGSLFILTRAVVLIHRRFLAFMMTAMILILMLTALFLTTWLEGNFFGPIGELNVAMKNIRDGNFEYVLQTGEKGEIGELYGNYEDMRLRLKESAEEKLEREKQSRELISNISHDLKTPITSIKGYVEGLIDGVAKTPEKQEKYIRTIYNKANDMDRLINELTLYSQIDSDKIPYNFRRLNVTDYFGDCIEEIGMDLEARGIELDYSNLLSPDTQIVADPEQMKRVINNIVGNSVKYMDKPDGPIEFRLLDEHDSVRIEIEDNGQGIAQRDLPNIFDRFYRTDTSRNSAKGGSGIGLSIVKKIVEDHGGYIWATSREGKGTCMHMVIRKFVDTGGRSVDIEAEESEE